MVKAKTQKRFEDYNKLVEKLKDKQNQENAVVSPLLNEADLKLVAAEQSGLTQGDILRMYVKNHNELDLKQRRQVYAKLQRERSTHAKEIFLKELSALGRKMKSQEFAKDELSRIKNKKDPLKLKLE